MIVNGMVIPEHDLNRKRLVVMQGVHGSGKSFIATLISCCGIKTAVFSADQFFTTVNGGVKLYRFDPTMLETAHETCQANVEHSMRNGIPLIVVDNTTIRRKHAIPYVRLADRYSYDTQILTCHRPLDTCHSENTHGVYRNVIDKAAESMEKIFD